MADGTALKTLCGSPNYAAPEIFKKIPYDGKLIDAWSAGVIAYIMVCGQFPFDDESQIRLLAKILKADLKFASSVSEQA